MRALQLLLLFKPASLLAHWAGTNDIFVFASSALAIIPLAKLLGEATEVLAEKTGPRIGGLLNATFGNAAGLIITLAAIRAGQIQLVLASLTGSILGNLLLVLGFSMFMGGLKNGRQIFDRRQVDTDATMLVLYLLFVVYTLQSCTKEKCDALTIREALPVHAWSDGRATAFISVSIPSHHSLTIGKADKQSCDMCHMCDIVCRSHHQKIDHCKKHYSTSDG